MLKLIEKSGDDNILSASEARNIVHWSLVVQKGNTYKFINWKDNAIFRCYVYNISPRRLEDFSHMTVVNTTLVEADKMPTDRNYCVIVNDIPHTFIYNVFKTAKHYPHQIYKIPIKLSDILKTYIKEYKIKDNEPLFQK